MISSKLQEIERKIKSVGIRPLDILLVGATGVGKSSTLNALFGDKLAKVGEGVDPETMKVNYYQVGDIIRIWDTPGLGDGLKKDKEHSKLITDTLCRTYFLDNVQYGLIDLVVVILDGGIRDMGTTYNLLEEVILPSIQTNRVMVVINQADMAMKGRYWDKIHNKPKHKLECFLNERASSIVKRIKEATDLEIKLPIYYSASNNYRIDSVLEEFLAYIPNQKRSLT